MKWELLTGYSPHMIKLFLYKCSVSHNFAPMDALENKSWWTKAEGAGYFGKNILGFVRWCHRNGILIRHGMVNKKEIFNCLARTEIVPRSSLYKRITTQKQGDTNEHDTTDLRNPARRIRQSKPNAGVVTSLFPGGADARPDDARRVGWADDRSPVSQPIRHSGLCGAV